MAIVSYSTDGKRRPFIKRWQSFPQARRIYTYILCSLAMTAILAAAYTNVSEFMSDASVVGQERRSSGVEIVPGLNGECGVENESAGKAFGFSLLYVLVNIYIFLGIAIICDNQFTASLEMICSHFGLNLNNDVAGATFMAAGSSAPELATSFVGTFLSDSNVGVGTIIGSAVFNILVIIGSTALLSDRPLQLDYRPVVRDNAFYFVSVIILICVIKVGGDDDIDTVDSVVLLVWYSLYICYMAVNEKIIEKFCPHEEEDDSSDEEEAKDAETPSGVHLEGPPAKTENQVPIGAGSGAETEMAEESKPDHTQDEPLPGKKKSMPKKKRSMPSHHYHSHQHPVEDLEAQDDDDDIMLENDSEDEEDEDGGIADMIFDVCAWPWEKLFQFTMPDCFYPFELIENIEDKIDDKWYYLGGFMEEDYPDGKIGEDLDPDNKDGLSYEEVRQNRFKAMSETDPEKISMLERQKTRKAARVVQLSKVKKEETKDLTCGQRWFWATFFISLLHITWMSYFMVEFMVKIGCLWHISDTVMGLTFLAMGTSIPDALGSLAVAQKGEGDMAVSNAVGSNVFDICMGLGLPWFIKNVAGDGPIKIEDTDTIVPSIIILVAIIVLLFTTFAVCKWQLVNQVGYILLTAYVMFVIYSLLYEAVK
eukprot:TRINITY_DN1734_c0_g1_i1.p1 TRINITY_DN1734_c0_g1~~TRINITY_DN1734_c0_g1_i1.p1  ORF type:complete len:650 (-),score=192.63 TRINITY_DN1734_c0_g1_i1:282-2231(-)